MENSTLQLDRATVPGDGDGAQGSGAMGLGSPVGEVEWEAVLEALRVKLGGELFDRWIAPIRVVSFSGSELALEVDGIGLQQCLEHRYLGTIRAVLAERLGCAPAVSLRAALRPEAAPPPGGARSPGAAIAWRRVEHARAGAPAAQPSRRTGREVTLASFVVGHSNSLAHKAAMEVLDDPGHRYNPLIVHGGSGVGKTHLLRALEQEFRSRKRPGKPEGDPYPFYRVIYVTAEEFFNQYAASVQDGTVRRFRERHRSQDVLILDDVQLLVDKKKTQIEFLHTFSSLFESGRQVILGSDVPPKALRMLDESLVCRFIGGLAVEIRKPDFETRLGIARNHAARLPYGIDDAALELVARNVRRGARDIEGAMLELRLHAAPGERITVERAATILAGILGEAGARIDFQRIVRAVAFHFGVPEEALVSKCRERHVTFARQVAVHLSRLYTKKSRTEIGKHFGKRDPSTVKSAEKKIERLLRSPGGDFTREIEAIKARIED